MKISSHTAQAETHNFSINIRKNIKTSSATGLAVQKTKKIN
jgi:hypothetical protein